MKWRKVVCLLLLVSLSSSVYVSAKEQSSVQESIFAVKDLDTQMKELYSDIAKDLDMDERFVEELFQLAGGKALYADKYPDIYSDRTITSAKPPMRIDGVETKQRFYGGDDSEYFLPASLFSVCYEVQKLMYLRSIYNRSDLQVYYNSLIKEVQDNITFYEAVLWYLGEPTDVVNNFYTAYEHVLLEKSAHENVVEVSKNGSVKIKDKFLPSFKEIGLKDSSIDYIARLFQFDEYLAESDDIEQAKSVYLLPYKPNLTTRENMMVAASCLVGKVRYVWGGGHSGASYIDGINPVWAKWENTYPQEAETTNEDGTVVTNEGYKTCIKPSGSWCPEHGYSHDEYHGGSVNSLDEYINMRAKTFDISDLTSDKYREMLSKVDYSSGINVHTLDGLDCSGFASWLYNQVTSEYEINSTAHDFAKQSGLNQLEFGSELLPGDIFAWTSHIVVIVGKVSDDSQAYVTVEQTPNVLRYGVVYYEGAEQADIQLATQIASEANELIGGLLDESPNVYCMNNQGYYTSSGSSESDSSEIPNTDELETVEVYFPVVELPEDPDYNAYDYVPAEYVDKTARDADNGNGWIVTYYINSSAPDSSNESENNGEVTLQYVDVARLNQDFLDTGFESKTAQQIIQHTLTKLPVSYVSGYRSYKGKLFDKSKVASSLGVSEYE